MAGIKITGDENMNGVYTKLPEYYFRFIANYYLLGIKTIESRLNVCAQSSFQFYQNNYIHRDGYQ